MPIFNILFSCPYPERLTGGGGVSTIATVAMFQVKLLDSLLMRPGSTSLLIKVCSLIQSLVHRQYGLACRGACWNVSSRSIGLALERVCMRHVIN